MEFYEGSGIGGSENSYLTEKLIHKEYIIKIRARML
jgi:hypothetical protein